MTGVSLPWILSLVSTLALAVTAAHGGASTISDALVREIDAGSTAASPASPERWLRRVWLDLAGVIPPREAQEAFLAAADATARSRVVDELLATPDFRRRWSRILARGLSAPAPAGEPLQKAVESWLETGGSWGDLLGILMRPEKPKNADPAGILEKQFDAASFAGHIGSGILGIRIGCARCHNDPVTGRGVSAYHGLAAFLGKPRSIKAPSGLVSAFRAGRIHNLVDLIRALPRMHARGGNHWNVKKDVLAAQALLQRLHTMGIGPRAPPRLHIDLWGANDVYRIQREQGAGSGAIVEIPIPGTLEKLTMPATILLPGRPADPLAVTTGTVVPHRYPGETEPAVIEGRPRDALIQWLESTTNPYTGKALVNRVWAELIGRGLVEPVDEIEKPPTAEDMPRLTSIAGEWARSGGTVQGLIAALVLSRTYGEDPGNLPPPGAARDGEPALRFPSLAPAIVMEVTTASSSPTMVSTASVTATEDTTEGGPGNEFLVETFRFPDEEAACTRDAELARPAPGLAAAGLRPLDVEQLMTSITRAAGLEPAAGDLALAVELQSALDLWAEGSRSDAAPDYPPRLLMAGSRLQEIVRTAPLLAILAGLPDDRARLEHLYQQVLGRSPTLQEQGVAPPADPQGWMTLLLRLFGSAEFTTR